MLTCFSSLYESIIYVEVGPEAIRFPIHKGLLCFESSYFKACLNGKFQEASEDKTTLEDEDPSIFRRFIAWLYTGKVLKDQETTETMSYIKICDLYILAEKRLVTRLQNTCIDAVINKHRSCNILPTLSVRRIWNNTSNKSPMRKLLVDLWVRDGDMAKFLDTDEEVNSYSKDFLASVIRAFDIAKTGDLLSEQWDFWNKRCLYHTHEDFNGDCT